MAHIGEEGGLGAVGRFRLMHRLGQLLLAGDGLHPQFDILHDVGVEALGALPRLAVIMAVGIAAIGLAANLSLVRAHQLASAPFVAALSYASVGFALVFDFAFFGVAPEALGWVGIGLAVGPVILLALAPVEGRSIQHALGRPREALDLMPEHHRRIEESIQAAEAVTSCEFRVHIDRRLEFDAAAAGELFSGLGVHGTTPRNGVLMLVGARTGDVWVVGDVGVTEVVDLRVLEGLAGRVAAALDGDDFVEGLCSSVREAGVMLAPWLPPHGAARDELPNVVSVL